MWNKTLPLTQEKNTASHPGKKYCLSMWKKILTLNNIKIT